MNRRGFLSLLAAAAAYPAIAELELFLPEKALFLPPVGGWVIRGNRLIGLNMIVSEALRILHANLAFATINKTYDDTFSSEAIRITRPIGLGLRTENDNDNVSLS